MLGGRATVYYWKKKQERRGAGNGESKGLKIEEIGGCKVGTRMAGL